MLRQTTIGLVSVLLVALSATQKPAISAEWWTYGKSTVCDKDKDKAKFSLNLRELEKIEASRFAYAFGLKIQQYVKRKDLQSLFGLVSGELIHGPRKKFVKGKSFSDIFSEEWRENVLSAKPDCEPVGWRGYMLGNGAIWYQGSSIISINGARETEASKRPPPDGSWKYHGELLSIDCFTTEWISSDNYEHYYDTFAKDKGIDWYKFSTYIGRFIGGLVPVEPIISPWPKQGREKLYLAVKLSQCRQKNGRIKPAMDGGWVERTNCEMSDLYDESALHSCLNMKYRLVKRIPLKHCQFLAPNFAGNCLDLGLVQISEATGGSMGPKIDEALYGIIKDPTSKEIYVIPLVNFSDLNDALNFTNQLLRPTLNGRTGRFYVSESWIIILLILYFLHSISILTCDFWHRSRADMDLIPYYVRRPTLGLIILSLFYGPLSLFTAFAGKMRRGGRRWVLSAWLSGWEIYYALVVYGLCLYYPKWPYIILLSAAHFYVRRIRRYTLGARF